MAEEAAMEQDPLVINIARVLDTLRIRIETVTQPYIEIRELFGVLGNSIVQVLNAYKSLKARVANLERERNRTVKGTKDGSSQQATASKTS